MYIIWILIVADVEILYDKLYKLFIEELWSLNIGYQHNTDRLSILSMLVQVLDYMEHAHLTNEEILEIVNKYEEI